ncbi:HAD family hydrolase [Paenibacillus glycanilyticus]|uniref:Phosphoglycolate phosphatase n=1 Tax=Paenibacillus glycanilyticus TaxID=126569 RepID=A0ABQ6G883_9BACL|nr:HAD family hydrolase [Paenibacillus glycanilyticus]GLX67164.1 phosphoglycolate phosphatase [Paenibacillus glycanilyticus]
MTTHQLKGILFDKDGTLIQFHSFWVPIAEELTDRLLAELNGGLPASSGLKEKLLQSIGLNANGKVDSKGYLAGGTTADIAGAYGEVLEASGYGIEHMQRLLPWITDEIYRLTQVHRDQLLPTTDLNSLLPLLKDKGLKLGIATADDLESTLFFLNKYGIAGYFDFIGTSDRYEKKPSPVMMNEFCKLTGLQPSEVAIAGDTLTDMGFAQQSNAGLAIGVLSGTSEREELAPYAGLILPSVGDLAYIDFHRKSDNR